VAKDYTHVLTINNRNDLMPSRLTRKQVLALRHIMDVPTMLAELKQAGWTPESCIKAVAYMAENGARDQDRRAAHSMILNMLQQAIETSGLVATFRKTRTAPDGSEESITVRQTQSALQSCRADHLINNTSTQGVTHDSTNRSKDESIPGEVAEGADSSSRGSLPDAPGADSGVPAVPQDEGQERGAGAGEAVAGPRIANGIHNPPNPSALSQLPGISAARTTVAPGPAG
jgi:hypothetical protein